MSWIKVGAQDHGLGPPDEIYYVLAVHDPSFQTRDPRKLLVDGSLPYVYKVIERPEIVWDFVATNGLIFADEIHCPPSMRQPRNEERSPVCATHDRFWNHHGHVIALEMFHHAMELKQDGKSVLYICASISEGATGDPTVGIAARINFLRRLISTECACTAAIRIQLAGAFDGLSGEFWDICIEKEKGFNAPVDPGRPPPIYQFQDLRIQKHQVSQSKIASTTRPKPATKVL